MVRPPPAGLTLPLRRSRSSRAVVRVALSASFPERLRRVVVTMSSKLGFAGIVLSSGAGAYFTHRGHNVLIQIGIVALPWCPLLHGDRGAAGRRSGDRPRRIPCFFGSLTFRC